MAIKTILKYNRTLNRLRPTGYEFPVGGVSGRLSGYEYGPGFIAASGGSEVTSAPFKITTFTGSSSWIISDAGSGNSFEYFIVAGGGTGGAGGGGGGGGGGIRMGYSPATNQTYTVTIGVGGPEYNSGMGIMGGNTSFGPLTATGGGGGAYPSSPTFSGRGMNGGSGGGGSAYGSIYTGGLANTSAPDMIGFNGGTGAPSYGGGGGGAGAAGGTYVSGPIAGNGGIGITSTISGGPTIYSAGGGGFPNGIGGNAPVGGGPATGQVGVSANPTSYGSGGSAGGPGGFAMGGSNGVVIIKWKYQL